MINVDNASRQESQLSLFIGSSFSWVICALFLAYIATKTLIVFMLGFIGIEIGGEDEESLI